MFYCVARRANMIRDTKSSPRYLGYGLRALRCEGAKEIRGSDDPRWFEQSSRFMHRNHLREKKKMMHEVHEGPSITVFPGRLCGLKSEIVTQQCTELPATIEGG